MKCAACFFAGLVIAVCAFPAQNSDKAKDGKTQKSTPAASTPATIEPKLNAVLSQMDAAAEKFNSAQADIASVLSQKIGNNADISTEKGSIYFRRTRQELQMAIAMTDADAKDSEAKDSSAKYVLLADGKVRMYQPHIDTVTEYTLGANRSDIEGMLALGFGGRGHDLLKSFDVQLLGDEMISGVKTQKLQLIPKTDRVKNMYSRILLWIDPASDISRRQQFWEHGEDNRLVNFSNIKTNQNSLTVFLN